MPAKWRAAPLAAHGSMRQWGCFDFLSQKCYGCCSANFRRWRKIRRTGSTALHDFVMVLAKPTFPAHDHDAAAMVAFLICERCGSVGEIPAMPAAQSINTAARATGFTPKLSVVEITGTCMHCQK